VILLRFFLGMCSALQKTPTGALLIEAAETNEL
jgi:hypothetical protein